MTLAYLDCSSGISGDMFIGALIDLGVDPHELEDELEKLKLDGYHLHVGRAHKAAIEKFVHSYGWGHGYAICALRPTGIYGTALPIEESKWYGLVQAVA